MECKRLYQLSLLVAIILASTGLLLYMLLKVQKELLDSCKPFAHSPGEHKIQVPGLKPFKVLCSDNSTVGPGWTIIQQRVNGKEEFQRDWNTYRDGFGSVDGDFF